jgi:ABC-type multidrug transport system ATPase subunit
VAAHHPQGLVGQHGQVGARLAGGLGREFVFAGYDVVRRPDQVRRSIGLAGQNAAVEEGITGRENLHLLGRLHHLGARGARRRAQELLDRFGLAEAADRLVRGCSGGMRRRLDLIASLVVEPAVLFLDEPTTGLDPRSRGEIWTAVRELAADGTTILLTTQYLDEADQLADDIVVMDHGRAIATGSPAQLKAAIGTRIEVTVPDRAQLEAAARTLTALTDGQQPSSDPDERPAALLGQSVADVLVAAVVLVPMIGAGLATGWRWHEGVARALAAMGLLLLFRFTMNPGQRSAGADGAAAETGSRPGAPPPGGPAPAGLAQLLAEVGGAGRASSSRQRTNGISILVERL